MNASGSEGAFIEAPTARFFAALGVDLLRPNSGEQHHVHVAGPSLAAVLRGGAVVGALHRCAALADPTYVPAPTRLTSAADHWAEAARVIQHLTGFPVPEGRLQDIVAGDADEALLLLSQVHQSALGGALGPAVANMAAAVSQPAPRRIADSVPTVPMQAAPRLLIPMARTPSPPHVGLGDIFQLQSHPVLAPLPPRGLTPIQDGTTGTGRAATGDVSRPPLRAAGLMPRDMSAQLRQAALLQQMLVEQQKVLLLQQRRLADEQRRVGHTPLPPRASVMGVDALSDSARSGGPFMTLAPSTPSASPSETRVGSRGAVGTVVGSATPSEDQSEATGTVDVANTSTSHITAVDHSALEAPEVTVESWGRLRVRRGLVQLQAVLRARQSAVHFGRLWMFRHVCRFIQEWWRYRCAIRCRFDTAAAAKAFYGAAHRCAPIVEAFREYVVGHPRAPPQPERIARYRRIVCARCATLLQFMVHWRPSDSETSDSDDDATPAKRLPLPASVGPVQLARRPPSRQVREIVERMSTPPSSRRAPGKSTGRVGASSGPPPAGASTAASKPLEPQAPPASEASAAAKAPTKKAAKAVATTGAKTSAQAAPQAHVSDADPVAGAAPPAQAPEAPSVVAGKAPAKAASKAPSKAAGKAPGKTPAKAVVKPAPKAAVKAPELATDDTHPQVAGPASPDVKRMPEVDLGPGPFVERQPPVRFTLHPNDMASITTMGPDVFEDEASPDASPTLSSGGNSPPGVPAGDATGRPQSLAA